MVAFALENLHQLGVQVHTGFSGGFQHRHGAGKVRVVRVARVEATVTQAKDIGWAVGCCRDRLGAGRAGVAVLVDLAHACGSVGLLACAASQRAALAQQGGAFVCEGTGCARKGALVGPASAGDGSAIDHLGGGAIHAPVGCGNGAASACFEWGALVIPDIGFDVVHGGLLERQGDAPARSADQAGRARILSAAGLCAADHDRGAAVTAHAGAGHGEREAAISRARRLDAAGPVGLQLVAAHGAGRAGIDRRAELEVVVALAG